MEFSPNMKTLILSIFATLAVLLSPVPALAAYTGAFDEVCDSAEAKNSDVCKSQNPADNPITETIGKVVTFISIIAGSVAVIVIIIAGIRFVVSSGDAAKVASARNTILYAIVGIVVIVLSNTIILYVLSKL